MTTPNLAHRFAYHPPLTDKVRRQHGAIRDTAGALAETWDLLPDSREKSCAFTALEEAMFWANAAIARNQEPPAKHGEPGMTDYLRATTPSCTQQHDCSRPDHTGREGACNGTPRVRPPAPPRPGASR